MSSACIPIPWQAGVGRTACRQTWPSSHTDGTQGQTQHWAGLREYEQGTGGRTKTKKRSTGARNGNQTSFRQYRRHHILCNLLSRLRYYKLMYHSLMKQPIFVFSDQKDNIVCFAISIQVQKCVAWLFYGQPQPDFSALMVQTHWIHCRCQVNGSQSIAMESKKSSCAVSDGYSTSKWQTSLINQDLTSTWSNWLWSAWHPGIVRIRSNCLKRQGW